MENRIEHARSRAYPEPSDMTPEQVLEIPPRVLAQEQREFYFDNGYLLAGDLAPILAQAGRHWDYLMEEDTGNDNQP